ncbi:ABC transporter permease [Herbaspirillum sp. C7C2]|uniref:MlaE family ABC transporter permease n=1 Tax=Herbaspirillum sp. C7C2 TaxID=2736666 RepID=UPI001F52A012|nr:ABC transporter permease [Herbaspirillum sp. C7C2]MCI1013285.1 ABC transporter permease [Herbaspirillum sp. C7C2]
MNTAATFRLEPTSPPVLHVEGDWTLHNYPALSRRIAQERPAMGDDLVLTFSALTAFDTVGAKMLVDLLGVPAALRQTGDDSDLAPAWRGLLAAVADAKAIAIPKPAPPPQAWITDVLERAGIATLSLRACARGLLGFAGLSLQTLVASFWRPSRWRFTAVVAQVEQTGLDAVPIVSLLTFMVGAVVAFLGATVLADFGASIYTVDLVAFSFLREFAVLLTAILMAGRTASSFTAQIGSMKANEEIDAIRALGMDPVNLLVLPRILALLVSMPILTFIAMMSGLLGGAMVCALSLDISPTMFLSLLQQDVGIRHFVLGMVKAPLFAFVIAIIGCNEGFKVSGSAQSVGQHTTSSVVQSIFVVILLDALAALFFMEMGW